MLRRILEAHSGCFLLMTRLQDRAGVQEQGVELAWVMASRGSTGFNTLPVSLSLISESAGKAT